MNVNKKDMRLYVVTDRTWLGGETLEAQVEKILGAGATFLQIREKNKSKEDFLHSAKQIKELAQRFGVPFVVNDDIEVALAAGADGVHIGQSDGSVLVARQKLGQDKILGVSAQTVAQARAAQEQGADYIGVGAVFATSTKTDANNVTLETVKEICAAVNIPVVAIGGISKDNMAGLLGSGVDGVAVISAIFAQGDKAVATKELLALSNRLFEREEQA